jgi:DNA-binding PadR family transcriptional regulator
MDDPNRFIPLSPHQFHILLALTESERHGYAVIQDIDRRTGGALRLGTGTLYTAIARLVELGLIADTGRADERRRYYRLMPLGRAVLRVETARLEALVRHAHARGVRPSVAPALPRRSS